MVQGERVVDKIHDARIAKEEAKEAKKVRDIMLLYLFADLSACQTRSRTSQDCQGNACSCDQESPSTINRFDTKKGSPYTDTSGQCGCQESKACGSSYIFTTNDKLAKHLQSISVCRCDTNDRSPSHGLKHIITYRILLYRCFALFDKHGSHACSINLLLYQTSRTVCQTHDGSE